MMISTGMMLEKEQWNHLHSLDLFRSLDRWMLLIVTGEKEQCPVIYHQYNGVMCDQSELYPRYIHDWTPSAIVETRLNRTEMTVYEDDLIALQDDLPDGWEISVDYPGAEALIYAINNNTDEAGYVIWDNSD